MKRTGLKTALMIALVGVLAGVLSVSSADAQKKGKKAAASETAAPRESAGESAVSEAPAQTAGVGSPISGGLIDVLRKFQGQKTNLGILKKLGKDFIEIEDENVTWTIPLLSVHSLKQTTDKDENDKPVTRLDIKLYAKD
jgi:hypothetical protein